MGDTHAGLLMPPPEGDQERIQRTAVEAAQRLERPLVVIQEEQKTAPELDPSHVYVLRPRDEVPPLDYDPGARARPASRSKYVPHAGAKELARRGRR